MKKLILIFLLIPLWGFSQTTIQNAWIDEGETYTDVVFEGTATVATTDKVIFNNCTFRSSENGLNIHESNGGDVEISYCTFEGLNPNKRGETQGKAVHAWRPAALKIEHNTGVGYRGFWIQEPKPGAPISIKYNHWTNIAGRPSDGNNGYLEQPDPNGENSQFTMITDVRGGNVAVEWNYIKNVAWESKVEDVINFLDCQGTKDNYLILSNNLIDGANSYSPTTVKNYSGSAIQVEALSKFVKVSDNYAIQASNHAIALSGTDNCLVTGNKIFHTGYLPGGERVEQVWRGLLIGNPFWLPGESYDNEAYDNTVGYPQNIGSNEQIWGQWDCLDRNDCHDNNILTRAITRLDETSAISEWFERLSANGLSIGADGDNPVPGPDPNPCDPIIIYDTVYVAYQIDVDELLLAMEGKLISLLVKSGAKIGINKKARAELAAILEETIEKANE